LAVITKPKTLTTNKARGMGLTVAELHLAATAAMAAEGAGMATTVVATRSLPHDIQFGGSPRTAQA
jgi:hypothetical protein